MTKNLALQAQRSNLCICLTAESSYQESQIAFGNFSGMFPTTIEMVLPNNNYLVRKIGTNKTQVLRVMRMRQFTSRQLLLDKRNISKEWNPDPEVSIKHDDLNSSAWECEDESPVFDAENKLAIPPTSPKLAEQSDL